MKEKWLWLRRNYFKFDFEKEERTRTEMESAFEKRSVWFQVMKVSVVKVRRKKRRVYAKDELLFFPFTSYNCWTSDMIFL